VSGTTPDPPAAALELEEDEVVVGAALLCSGLSAATELGGAQAAASLLPAREDVLRSRLETGDPDIVDQVTKLWL